MMQKILTVVVALILAVSLVGCTADTPPSTVSWSGGMATYEGEGYTLRYPDCFSLVQETPKSVNFAVPGGNMAFTLTAEENPYGERAISEYPALMGIYGATVVNDRAFSVEKYQTGFLSAYYLYTFTPDTTYLLEYNFGGEEEQRAMTKWFSIEPT